MVFAILVFFTFTSAWAVRTVDLSATRAGPEIIAYNEVAIPSVSQLEAVIAVKKFFVSECSIDQRVLAPDRSRIISYMVLILACA